MNRFIIFITLFWAISIGCLADNVSFQVSGGLEDAAKVKKIEDKLTLLLNEINAAQTGKRDLDFAKLKLDDYTAQSLSMLWENSPFRIADDEIVENVLTLSDGYQVRNIPLLMCPPDDRPFNEDEYQEGVISFDKNGNIKSFYLSLSLNLYMNVIKENLELTDLRRRQMILDYVERFRTSYNQKDIQFLDQVFSDDALIITGKVVRSQRGDMAGGSEKIQYSKQTKQQYLTNLRRVFRNNEHIRVTFDEIKVMRHPANVDFYGVTLHQGFTSDSYHDDGYIFLLWDFQDESQPQIHVRTWQPDKINGKKLPEKEIFNLGDFDI